MEGQGPILGVVDGGEDAAEELRRLEQAAMGEVAVDIRRTALTLPPESETRHRLLRLAELEQIAAGPAARPRLQPVARRVG